MHHHTYLSAPGLIDSLIDPNQANIKRQDEGNHSVDELRCRLLPQQVAIVFVGLINGGLPIAAS